MIILNLALIVRSRLIDGRYRCLLRLIWNIKIFLIALLNATFIIFETNHNGRVDLVRTIRTKLHRSVFSYETSLMLLSISRVMVNACNFLNFKSLNKWPRTFLWIAVYFNGMEIILLLMEIKVMRITKSGQQKQISILNTKVQSKLDRRFFFLKFQWRFLSSTFWHHATSFSFFCFRDTIYNLVCLEFLLANEQTIWSCPR